MPNESYRVPLDFYWRTAITRDKTSLKILQTYFHQQVVCHIPSVRQSLVEIWINVSHLWVGRSQYLSEECSCTGCSNIFLAHSLPRVAQCLTVHVFASESSVLNSILGRCQSFYFMCSWARQLPLCLCLPTVYKWVLANSCSGQTYVGLASHPGGSRYTSSCFMLQDPGC